VSTVSRLGGDEFILLLQDLREEANAVNIAERILEEIREPWSFEGSTFQITTSIGIAYFSGTDNLDSKVILKNADSALYQAKEAGRNTYSVFGQDSR
jgi:diguanylate cyclase (GGDEF)-like protein